MGRTVGMFRKTGARTLHEVIVMKDHVNHRPLSYVLAVAGLPLVLVLEGCCVSLGGGACSDDRDPTSGGSASTSGMGTAADTSATSAGTSTSSATSMESSGEATRGAGATSGSADTGAGTMGGAATGGGSGTGTGTTGGALCGWDARTMAYACGFSGEAPSGNVPINCPEGGLFEGNLGCDLILPDAYAGCCDANGDLWWCDEDNRFVREVCGG